MTATVPADDRSDPRAAPRIVEVLIPSPLDRPYSYLVPEDQETPPPGAFVEVQFGPRPVVGIVWGHATDGTDAQLLKKLKPIRATLKWPPVPLAVRNLAARTARYGMTPLGLLARALMPPTDFDRPERKTIELVRADPLPKVRLTPARQAVLDLFAASPPDTALMQDQVRRDAGASLAVLNGMVDVGLLHRREVAPVAPTGPAQVPTLSEGQAAAAEEIARYLGPAFEPILLQGITGAGKTEVYFDAIARTLARSETVLVLLPEIALTTDWIGRFFRRFGFLPTVWHSEVGGRGKKRAYREIIAGRARVLVGARSALWQPLQRIGLIIVDEEHDGSFKQEDNGSFNARDMAVLRAQEEACAIILASATPSLETRENAEQGRYRHVRLDQRFAEAQLPTIKPVDLRAERLPADQFITEPARVAVEQAIGAGQQALFYLNRRGYAPLTLCRTCGHRFQCSNCSAWLVHHKLRRRLSCHHCGMEQRLPEKCPKCEAEGPFAACGPGVERLADEVAQKFPDARVGVAVSDSFAGPRAIAEFLDQAKAGAFDILIGTQILAKGQNLPLLSKVVIVDGDLGLTGGDPRAAERTFQLLTQVSGRAGRFEIPGEVFLQTSNPDDPLFTPIIAGDFEAFYTMERKRRQAVGLPPFGRLAAVILSHTNEPKLLELSRSLARSVPSGSDFAILGPAPAPIYQLRGRFRQRFIVKTARAVPIQRLIAHWLDAVKLPGQARLSVDIDPYSFM